ncbi:MAG: MaoC family dehydratase [Dehalococcoidia bacterium]
MAKIFADLKIGDELTPAEFDVTPEWVENDARFKEDPSPWYTGPSPWGGPVAPPTLTNADFDRFLRANDFLMSGIIPTKTSHEYHGPVKVGSRIRTTCTVVDVSERKGRHYVTFEFLTTDDSGKVLVKKRDTLLQMPQGGN